MNVRVERPGLELIAQRGYHPSAQDVKQSPQWLIGRCYCHKPTKEQPQIPRLRACGAPLGMTKQPDHTVFLSFQ